MVQQLTIFDSLLAIAFEIDDTVEVVVNVDESEVEDYYYLKTFEGAKGKVIKVLPKSQYKVLFAKVHPVGIFRQDELRTENKRLRNAVQRMETGSNLIFETIREKVLGEKRHQSRRLISFEKFVKS